ncbi:hypothetical protein ACFLY2_03370, partial [Patescibacteria group bacterium]
IYSINGYVNLKKMNISNLVDLKDKNNTKDHANLISQNKKVYQYIIIGIISVYLLIYTLYNEYFVL